LIKLRCEPTLQPRTEEILDEDDLYRRFPNEYLDDYGNLSSAAFQNTTGTDDMSVDLARMTTPEKTAVDNEIYGVAMINAGFARSNNQIVIHSPSIDNNAHSTVRGNKTRGIKKKLAESAHVILRPKIH
jgi:hypothetical protein